MAYDTVTEETVYQTAGAPLPRVIDALWVSMLNDNFSDAYTNLRRVRSNFHSRRLRFSFFPAVLIGQTVTENGYALCDVVTCLSLKVAGVELPDEVRASLLSNLSTAEFQLSHGVNEKIQVGAVVGAFILARAMMTGTASK